MCKTAKIISKIIVLSLMVSLVIMGCTPARRPIDERDRVDINQERMDNGLNNMNNQNQENFFDNNNLGFDNIPNNLNLSYNLEQSIKNINGIGDAVVIINNDTAYVGIEAEDGRDENDLRNIQSEVAGRIRRQAQEIERVYVTSDMARVEEIRELRQRSRNGESPQGINNELERLFS